jgi:hypothetical protein
VNLVMNSGFYKMLGNCRVASQMGGLSTSAQVNRVNYIHCIFN